MTTFPQAPLDAQCDLLLGATWTGVTSYAMQRSGTSPPVTITRGRQDETAQATAQTATWSLNNRDGRFSERNATGPYFGLLMRNTQARWSVPAASTYLRLHEDAVSSASCPDAAGLHITSDIDIRADLRLTGWASGIIAGKWVQAGSANSWLLVLNGDGTLTLFWSTTGSDFPQAQSAVPLIPQVTATSRFSVRVTMDVNNGASGRTITFYTGPAGGANGSTWTQLGPAIVQSGTTSINAGTAGISAGNYFTGGELDGVSCSMYELEVRSGIGGSVVAHPVFSSQTAGATSFSDGHSNTWTLNGTAELSGRDYRFHGECFMPPRWDNSGRDIWTPVTASGPLRRLGQGTSPVASAMKRAVLSQTGTLAVHAYWPCEDTQGSTAIASAIGGPAMTMTGGTGDGTVSKTGADFGADSSFASSLSLPQFANSAWLGQVPTYSSNGSLIVRFLLNVSTGPVDSARLMRVITTGSCREFVLIYHTAGGLEIAGFGASGAGVFTSGNVAFGALANPMWVSMELRPGGGSTVDWSLETMTPGGGAVGTSGTFTGSIGIAQQVQPGPTQLLGAVAMGHISVQSDWQSLFGLSQPLNAWIGETAASRFSRLCLENGLVSRIIGPPATTVAMGAQSAQSLTSLLQECEKADQGQIYEPREVLGLAYRTSASMTDQAAAVTLDYSAGQLGLSAGDNGLIPGDDDYGLHNDITVTRPSGSSATATLTDGSPTSISVAGDYNNSDSANLQSDTQLPDAAGWRLHIGSVDAQRFPVIPLNLARAQLASLTSAIQAMDIGDYLQIVNVPAFAQTDSIRQLALGYSEPLGGQWWQLLLNCVPEAPWETGIADDVVLGRADTDGSTLAGWGPFTASGGATSGGALSGYYWALLTAQAAQMSVGDTLTVTSGPNAGVTVYTVTAFEAPFAGFVNTHMSPNTPGTPSAGDVLTLVTLSPTSTSLAVATTSAKSPLWTTAGGDFPFDIRAGGEQMTVTNITGSSSPQTFTVTRSVNGVVKAHTAGEDVRLAHPMILALI